MAGSWSPRPQVAPARGPPGPAHLGRARRARCLLGVLGLEGRGLGRVQPLSAHAPSAPQRRVGAPGRARPRWASAIGGGAGTWAGLSADWSGPAGAGPRMHLRNGAAAEAGQCQDVGGSPGAEADQPGGGYAPGPGLEPLVPRHAVRRQPRAALRPHPYALLGAGEDAGGWAGWGRRAARTPRP